MGAYEAYKIFIICIKIGFILMALVHLYLMVKGKKNSPLDHKIMYWKERFEFIFMVLMAMLLIYLFSPSNQKNSVLMDKETLFLLRLFGVVIILTSDWKMFLGR